MDIVRAVMLARRGGDDDAVTVRAVARCALPVVDVMSGQQDAVTGVQIR